MGQYYMPTIIGEHGDVETLRAHDFGNGLKLMEHSWIGNDFVNEVLSRITARPNRLAWIGDYSNEPYDDIYSKALPEFAFNLFYNMAWNRESDVCVKPKAFSDYIETSMTVDTKGWYLVNHTLREYVDIEHYIKANRQDDGKCINPLPLLTACGNGRGGGDYRGISQDLVGSWAFDLIGYTKILPIGFDQIFPMFCEG